MIPKWQSHVPINSVDPEALSDFFSGRESKTRFRPFDKSPLIKVGLSFHALPNLNFWEDIFPRGAIIDVNPIVDNVGLVIAAGGSCNLQTSIGTLNASESRAIISHDHEVSQVLRNPCSHLRVVSIPRSVLARVLSSHIGAPIDKPLHFLTEIDLNRSELLIFKHFAQMFSDGLVASDIFTASPLTATNISEALFTSILTRLPHNLSHLYDKQTYSGSSWQLRRAIEYMMEHASEPIKSSDIAEACSISVSSMYKMFKEQRATTPKLMLKQIRLKAAYDDIMNPEIFSSITEIGRKWGFINMGDFAAQFQEAFGGLPSQISNKIRPRRKL